MRVVCISDNHMATPELESGDLLIHAGDLTYRGRPEELNSQIKWFKGRRQYYDTMVLVPGNHDFGFEQNGLFWKEAFAEAGVTVLNNERYTYQGFNLWGSPFTPWFHSWAFNEYRGADLKRHWDLIPEDTDILVTHGPPHGILDACPDDYGGTKNVGCLDLLDAVKRITPKLHVFGHIHEGYGMVNEGGVLFVNASYMDGDYRPGNPPIVVDL